MPEAALQLCRRRPRSRCAPASLLPLGLGRLAGGTSKLLKPAGRGEKRAAERGGQRSAGVGVDGGHGDAARDGKGKQLCPICTARRRSRRKEEIQPLFCLWPKLKYAQKSYGVCASSLQAAPETLPKALKTLQYFHKLSQLLPPAETSWNLVQTQTLSTPPGQSSP